MHSIKIRVNKVILPPVSPHIHSLGPLQLAYSRGIKPPYWRAKVPLGQDKQRKLPFKIMYAFYLSCPSATFALQHGGFAPRELLAAKGQLIDCYSYLEEAWQYIRTQLALL